MLRTVTHSGIFHTDEIYGIALLKICFPNIKVERTRVITEDMRNDKECILVDVGYTHEPRLNNFDHHQSTPDVEGLCAFGLVFQEFGQFAIGRYLNTDNASQIKFVFNNLKNNLSSKIDLWDTGGVTEHDVPDTMIPIQTCFKKLNGDITKAEEQDAHFNDAVMIATIFLKGEIRSAHKVLKSIEIWNSRSEYSKEIVIMDDFCMSWKNSNAKLTTPYWFAIWPTVDEHGKDLFIISAHNSKVAHLVDTYPTNREYITKAYFQAGYTTLADAIKCTEISVESKMNQISNK